MAQDLHPASKTTANTVDASNGYIEHQVSKLDTLAGVAIKYGVEVADVKRLNGLVSDFQMFAHKTLRIPVGRRHSAASSLVKSENPSLSGCSHCSRKAPNLNIQLDTVNSHEKRGRDKRPLTSAMNLLRGYYGLSSPAQQADVDAGMEMSSYKPEIEEHSDDEPFSPLAVPSKNGHRRFNGFHNSRLNGREMGGSLTSAKGQISEVVQTSGVGETVNERAVRRRFKTEAINPPATCYDDEGKQDIGMLEKMLPVSGLLGGAESSSGLPVAILKVLDGALVGGKGKESPISKVKKSSSTSSLQDQTGPQFNLGAQKYGSKVEVKSASPLRQGGARTSVDVPPKPMNYRFKAALD